MTLSLDTCTVIDILRENSAYYRERFQGVVSGGRQVVISSFVLHELTYGAMISTRPDIELALIDRLVERVSVQPWTAEDAIVTAKIRADLKRSGTPMGAVDALIAGQALNRDWSIVTSNVRDFVRVDGLTIIDWSDPAQERVLDRASWLAGLDLPKEPK